MFCTACGTKNTSDANFCKQCGRRTDRTAVMKISEDAFAEAGTADEQVRSYLVRAYDRYEVGDLTGAIESCAKALGVQPNSTDAHSLLSTLYEKQGEREKSIVEREIVLQLNPGSIADREKLEQLRDSATVVTPRKITSSRPSSGSLLDSRAGAAVIAVAVTLFVMVSGLAAVLVVRSRMPATQVRGTGGAGFTIPNRANGAIVDSLPQNSAASVQPPAPTSPRVNFSGTPQIPQQSTQLSRPQSSFAQREDELPARQIPPAIVRIPSNAERFQSSYDTQNAQSNRTGNASNTVHLPDNGLNSSELGPPPVNQQTSPPVTQQSPPKNHGKIEIIVSNDPNAGRGLQGGSGLSRISDVSSSSLDSRSVKRIAQDYQLKGQYKLAISNYIKALDGAGDDAASLHYQIALCYQRLDERDSAISQYTASIAAYKQMAASGQNVDAANRGIRAAEAGIKACQ
jgi:tetratricopeptide (TPR) repeat protein